MADQLAEIKTLLRSYKRECETRLARADECDRLAAIMESAGELLLALQMRRLGRDHRVQALDLKGQMAAIRFEHKLAPFLDV